MKLVIAYFDPKLLNLYGDNGNVEILVSRAERRNIDAEVIEVSPATQLNDNLLSNVNLVFMGGGPDSGQQSMYNDLLKNKGSYLKEYVENDGVGLFICGAYQLLGHYYKAADGSELRGLSIFDLRTQHFGNHKPRCIGNMVCSLPEKFLNDSVFKSVNSVGDTLVGFENHGGRTYLGENVEPLASVITGFGNNGEDKTEGAVYKNAFGTYNHGPILSKNPHLADYLIAKALGVQKLESLNDKLILTAHTTATKLKQ